MATATRIEFRAKVRNCTYTDGSIASSRIQVPRITSTHCDMNMARKSRKYGGYANSDLFPAMMRRAAIERGCRVIGDNLFVDMLNIPAGITVDTTGFLALVTIDIPDVD